MDAGFEGNGMFQSAPERNDTAPPKSGTAGAACSVGGAASVACSVGGAHMCRSSNHYPSAADNASSPSDRAKISKLEVENKMLSAQVERLLETSSAWGHHTCDGCKKAVGSVRFRCMTCPDGDYCVQCLLTNNKFCGHTMQVVRGGFANTQSAPAGGVGMDRGATHGHVPVYAQYGYGAAGGAALRHL